MHSACKYSDLCESESSTYPVAYACITVGDPGSKQHILTKSMPGSAAGRLQINVPTYGDIHLHFRESNTTLRSPDQVWIAPFYVQQFLSFTRKMTVADIAATDSAVMTTNELRTLTDYISGGLQVDISSDASSSIPPVQQVVLQKRGFANGKCFVQAGALVTLPTPDLAAALARQGIRVPNHQLLICVPDRSQPTTTKGTQRKPAKKK